MYDLFSMEKLLESAKIAEKIADGVVDDQAYNVLTQCVNEEVLIEGRAEVESILENASEISGEFDLDQLAKEVKEALPEAVAPKVAPKVAAKAKVAPKAKVEATAKKECAEACKDKCECKGECKAKTEADYRVSAIASNPGKPAAGMDSIEKFLNAAPVKQKDFVDANTNSEHTSSGSADKAEVDKNATSIQKEMVKDADSKKKFEEVAKKQNKVNLTESINKFKGFVESIKTDENTKFVDAVLKGFDIIWK